MLKLKRPIRCVVSTSTPATPRAEASRTAHAGAHETSRAVARGLIATVLVALGLAIAIQAWVVKPYKIPTGSMEPTLVPHQRVLVDRIFKSLSIGQIVVFHPPKGADNEQCGRPHPATAACDWPNPESSETFVKRIVAGPGDVITIQDGHVIRNGHREADGYTSPCFPGEADCTYPTHPRTTRYVVRDG